MPGRDYASTDHVYGTRNFPTACAALILPIKQKHLQITGDHALLAQLVPRLRPDEKEAQSMAGIYLEINGQTREADECFEKAGPELKEMSDTLFE